MKRTRSTGRASFWTAAVMAVALPFVLVLCATLWQSPFPVGDSVGIFEDIERRPASSFLLPSSSYYRPLFYLSVAAMWHGADSIAGALTAVRFLHIVPITAMVLLFIWHLRPKTAIEAAAATLATAVLVGSPGFLGNLELPLSYTIVGMLFAVAVWMLLERERRWWHGPAIVALTIGAIGFKEQGLVIVPIVLAGWWMGAPGASRTTAATVAAIAAVYVVFRLAQHDSRLPMFEQDIGLGLAALSASDAEDRFGAFPYWLYAYSAASTVANVLFAEPTDGTFRFVRAFRDGQSQPWHFLYVASSVSLTGLIAWWSLGAVRQSAGTAWSPESRLALATILALAASGVLSFNYSRDRLGGMAVVFYAFAAFFAVRGAATRAAAASRVTAAVVAIALLLLAGAWQLRALYTIEFTRQRGVNSQREWITHLRRREADFADRPVYLETLHGMLEQGTSRTPTTRTAYPRWMLHLLGEY